MKHLLCLGFGLSAQSLADRLDPSQWKITGTSRSDAGVRAIAARGYEGVRFDALAGFLESVTHVVSSVPPDDLGDPVLRRFGSALAAQAKQFRWVAYLSTTGVYGDHEGGWVDEDTPFQPATERGHRRVAAETAWRNIEGLPLHVFRLAGIYGPGRNQLLSLQAGKAQRVIKPGQVFSRIHVADIAGILLASMAKPEPGRAYNCADDEPCPPQDVVAYGATLLGLPIPPDISFSDAQLSDMGRSFYAESKRVSNARIKSELGYVLHYPTYREGLAALAQDDP